MHLQIRCAPAKSPPDLKAYLTVIHEAGFNIEAAGGSLVEKGGEFAFAVAHGQEEDAVKALKKAGYKKAHIVEVDLCWMTNSPGQLLACVADVANRNAGTGKAIKDLSIGVPGDDGRIPVQIYSE